MTAPLYLDANAVIRIFEARDEAIGRFLRRLEAERVSICTSELTLAEVLVRPLREGADELVGHYEAFLQTGEGVVIVPLNRAILRESAVLRAEFGGKAPDAIHVASAMSLNCRILLSSDKRLRVPPQMHRLSPDDLHDGIALS